MISSELFQMSCKSELNVLMHLLLKLIITGIPDLAFLSKKLSLIYRPTIQQSFWQIRWLFAELNHLVHQALCRNQ